MKNMEKKEKENIYEIDLSGIYSVEELQDLLREKLPLPAYYGGTLDALYDVLTDEGINWSINISGTDDAEAILGKYMRNFKKMCRRVNEESGIERIRFDD